VFVLSVIVEVAEYAGEALRQFRLAGKPIHCIASSADESFTLRILDAVGSVATTTHDAREIDSFMSTAAALVVQLGSTNDMRENGIATAIEEARANRIPWVLDTSFAGRSPFRSELVRTQMSHRPSIVRSSAADLAALMTRNSASPAEFATRFRTVSIGCSSEIQVSDGVRHFRIAYGAPNMLNQRMLASARSVLCAAMASIEKDFFKAAVAGLAVTETAASVAADTAIGPGTFSILFLDALASIDQQHIAERIKIEVITGRS
jgi:hydroxyethylthiazole kinase